MEYVITGSNSVTNGDPLELTIMISRENMSAISPLGVFSVDRLNFITDYENLQGMVCELWGKTQDENGKSGTSPVCITQLPFDSNNPGKRLLIIRDTEDYMYLMMKIKANKCTIKGFFENLEISFKDKHGTDPKKVSSITFTVAIEEAKPEIKSFEPDVTVTKTNGRVVLSWNAKGKTYRLTQGLKELKSGDVSDQNESFEIKNIATGDHSYTLEVKIGNAAVTKTIRVRALSEPGMYQDANPSGECKNYTIANFCVAQDSGYIFSLMLKKNGIEANVDHIGYTNRIDGFSEKWSKITLSEGERIKLKPFATSPLVHMKSAGEVHGRLIFIGGSYVKPMECSNAVAIIHLDAEEDSRVLVDNAMPWGSRMGHSCTVFTHGDIDKIWMAAGISEWGEALNDVWVSGDGKNWNNITADGSTNTSGNPSIMPWKERYLNGITVELTETGAKKALWLGGGFSEIGGSETADVWKWTRQQWKQAVPVKINSGNYQSSALAFIGKDAVDGTGVLLLGAFKDNDKRKSYFEKIVIERSGYARADVPLNYGSNPFDSSADSKIITSFFKGCMWCMVITNMGDAGISYSKLYYWVPVPNSESLILV